MALTVRAIAVQGLGYEPRLIAVQGLWPEAGGGGGDPAFQFLKQFTLLLSGFQYEINDDNA